MKKYLETNYSRIKDNITMIALVPTVAGGIWQLIKLGTISVSMIRFFSISQLITDGIIILIFIAFPLLFFNVFFLNEGIFNALYEEKNYSLKNKLRSIFKNGLHISRLFLYLTFFLFFVVNSSQSIQLNNLYKLACVNLSFLLVAAAVFFIFFNFLQKHSFLEVYFVLCNICLLFLSLYSLHRNYQLPDNISNFNLLIGKLEKEKCYSKKPEILYFNDKYIFIELIAKNKKEILVKKIDDLFEE